MTRSSLQVEIVTVGDELLVGDVVDTNSAWLSGVLTAAGFPVIAATAIGDDTDAIVAVLRVALRRADAVVITGGLGPTSDDLTRQALARLAGVALIRDAGLERALLRWYADRGVEPPVSALQEADVPEGAAVLPNSRGSAPGLSLTVGPGVVYAVPGVPQEMRAMVEHSVLPSLRHRAGGPVTAPAVRVLRTAGVGEATVAGLLAPLETELRERGGSDPVRVAYLAEPGEVRIRLTSYSPAAADSAATRARGLLGDLVYGTGDETLDVIVHRLLASQGATVAVAESLTGGLLSAALTDMPGSSATFRGALTTYGTDLKASLAGVDADLLAAEGAVHPEVARQMALGVRACLDATFGVATTGVAGPDPQDGRPVGTVHLAAAGPEGVTSVSLMLTGDRARIRRVTVVRALDLLRRTLLNSEGNELGKAPE